MHCHVSFGTVGHKDLKTSEFKEKKHSRPEKHKSNLKWTCLIPLPKFTARR